MLAIDKWVEVAEKRLCELQPGFRLTDFRACRIFEPNSLHNPKAKPQFFLEILP